MGYFQPEILYFVKYFWAKNIFQLTKIGERRYLPHDATLSANTTEREYSWPFWWIFSANSIVAKRESRESSPPFQFGLSENFRTQNANFESIFKFWAPKNLFCRKIASSCSAYFFYSMHDAAVHSTWHSSINQSTACKLFCTILSSEVWELRSLL